MQPLDENIYVTKPYLPPKEEYEALLEEIWASSCLTNNGPLHQRLERELKNYLKVDGLTLFTNGHLALEAMIEAYALKGEVITTPFTFASTTHAIVRHGLKPVYVDVKQDDFTMDPATIEAYITPQTAAIIPVHVFGYPCDVEAIEKIADTYGLKVIYDAAHAFGVSLRGRGIGSYGDAAMFSMHATKVYHTIEGGAIICKDYEMKKKLDQIKNFGIVDSETVVHPGMNAKMNEFQAAMGLMNLKYIDKQIGRRKQITMLYREKLKDIPGIRYLEDVKDTNHNYGYMPILVDEEVTGISRDTLHKLLESYHIYTRKYFYPLITSFKCYEGKYETVHLKNAKRVAEQVLTLPIYGEMEDEVVIKVVEAIQGILESQRGKL